MALPPAGEWIATDCGVSRWRPHLTTVSVEPCGESGQRRLLTVREDGAVVALANLSAEQAAHLAALLVPQVAA